MSLKSYEIFKKNGAELLCPSSQFIEKAADIHALIFDWDGVFHDGRKDNKGNSSFSEIDAMAVNMLRFGYYLHHGIVPKAIIITGEENHTGFALAKREHFDAVYFKIKNKLDVAEHLEALYSVRCKQMLFLFDEILDLSLANKVGLRLMIRRDASPLFKIFCKEGNYYDYHTAYTASNNALRECSELVMESLGIFNTAVQKRIDYDKDYKKYINTRNNISSRFFTLDNHNSVVEKYTLDILSNK